MWLKFVNEEKLQKILKNKKHTNLVYLILIIGVVLLAITSFFPEEEQAVGAESTIECENIEEELEEILSQMAGVGKTKVLITYESDGEKVVAKDIERDKSETSGRSSEKVVTVNSGGGQVPIILSQRSPGIKGVLVICDGGADANVRKRLMEAIEAVTNVSTHNIAIFEKRK